MFRRDPTPSRQAIKKKETDFTTKIKLSEQNQKQQRKMRKEKKHEKEKK